MARKRGLSSTQSTQSTQSSSTDTRPPAKKAKTTETISILPPSLPPIAPQVTPTEPTLPNRAPLPPPPKRKIYEGTLRRLAVSTRSTIPIVKSDSAQVKSKTQANATLSGSKIGGKSKDLKDGIVEEQIWVNRMSGKGLGFSGYLKKGVQAVVEKGMTTLRIHGMGAAIPMALSLALAIRDALPGSEGPEGDNQAVKMEVRTGSIEVGDEITPLQQSEDIIYQTRTKSTVEIVLRISDLILAPRKLLSRTSGGDRGNKRHGSRGGTGGGRGDKGNGRGRGKGGSKTTGKETV